MKQIIILFYNKMWGGNLNLHEVNTPGGFQLTEDKTLFNTADAIVFHMPTLELEEDLIKGENQIWVYWSMECEKHYPHLNTPDVLELFDIKMTYKQDSDVVLSYIESQFEEELHFIDSENINKSLVNVFVSSPFNESKRFEYLSELMKHLDVHSYGRMYNNKSLKNDDGRPTKLLTYSKYKFTLAFENSLAKDYVTEKFYEPLISGSVPIYLGAPNIDEFSPGENCFINVVNFSSPIDLAEYIKILDDDSEKYSNYFAWKDKPFLPDFHKKLNLQKQHPFIRLCYKVEEKLNQIQSL